MNMNNNVKVSIICNAYNHEKYIESALKGFVMQKTDFAYEVLVHDDASTDGTRVIIEKYHALYPQIIIPIYQSENQYSRKVKITKDIQLPRAKGEYIALCEGDDYWIDEYKLQKQFDLLEKNKQIDMCAHAAYIEVEGVRKGRVYPSNKEKIYTIEETIINDGDFFPTAALFARKRIFESNLKVAEYSMDYSWQMLGGLSGGILYIPEIMSVYRFQANGSWSARMNVNEARLSSHYDKMLTMLETFNIDTKYKFSHIIEFQKASYLFRKGCMLSDEVVIKKAKQILCVKEYRDCYMYYGVNSRVRKYIKFHLDCLFRLW